MITGFALASCGTNSGSYPPSVSEVTSGGGGTPTTGGAISTTGSTSATGGDAGALVPLGASCAVDQDCGGAPARCLKATDDMVAGSGPAGGYCTLDCATSAAACAAAHGTCVQYSEGRGAWCMQACHAGSACSTKCRARPDVACAPLDVGSFCAPQCRSDADCGALHCQLSGVAAGFCGAATPSGEEVGAACSPSGLAVCAGICLPQLDAASRPVVSSCSRTCTLGVAGACGGPVAGDAGAAAAGGNADDADGVSDGGDAAAGGDADGASDGGDSAVAAGGAVAAAGLGSVCDLAAYNREVNDHNPPATGDLGFCLQLCDQASDCADTIDELGCDTSASAIQAYGHGVCTWAGYLKAP